MKKILALAVITAAALFALVAPAKASQNYVISGTTYTFPDVDDEDWGQDVTDWAGAVTRETFQKKSGTFALTTEAWFGPNYGIRSIFYKGMAPQVSTSAVLRLGATEYIGWRNAGNTQDLYLSISSTDSLMWKGISIPTGSPSGIQIPSTSSVLYNLIITTNGTDSNQLVVTAESMDIMGCYFSNAGIPGLSVSSMPAVSTSVFLSKGLAGGAGGGSNLADTANMWYRIFAIAKTDCSTMSVIVDSAPIVSPTLPTGYTKWRPLGYVYNDSSSNIVPIYKHGKKVAWHTGRTLVSNATPVATETIVPLGNIVSPSATSITYKPQFQNNGVAPIRCILKVGNFVAADVIVVEAAANIGMSYTGAGSGFFGAGPITHDFLGVREVWYAADTTGNNCQAFYLFGLSYEEDN